MWTLLAVVALIGSPIVGGIFGAEVGEGLCHDDEYAILRCMDESLGGLAIGALAGLVIGIVLAVLAIQKSRELGEGVSD